MYRLIKLTTIHRESILRQQDALNTACIKYSMCYRYFSVVTILLMYRLIEIITTKPKLQADKYPKPLIQDFIYPSFRLSKQELMLVPKSMHGYI